MTSINYPHSVLPSPLVSNARHQEEARLIRTRMDSGYTVARKRFTKVPVNFDFQLILDEASLSYFQAFFKFELDYGLNWFNMNMPVGDSVQSSHEIRFIENPNYTWNGKFCTVTCKCEGNELNTGINYDTVMLGLIDSLGGGVRGFETASNYLNKIDVAINNNLYNAFENL